METLFDEHPTEHRIERETPITYNTLREHQTETETHVAEALAGRDSATLTRKE